MTLATSAKDVRFYKWPNISYIGIHETPPDCMSVKSISWSCDGKVLLAVKSKGCPVILDVPTRLEESVEAVDCNYIKNATVGTFSNNTADLLAFGTEDGYILIYDSKRPQRPQECIRIPNSIQHLEFSADDQFLVAGCVSGPIVLFDSNYKPCASFVVPNSPTLASLAYSKLNPSLLAGASKDGILSLWNAETTDNLFTSKQHTARITDISFYENGLSSVGIDGKFVSYDLRSYQACSCELDCSLSSLAYLYGTYELAVSTTSGQLRSYDSRNMKSPLRTLIAIANSGIKKIAFPSHPEICPTEFNSRLQRPKLEDDFSASGDFSIASGSSPRRSHLDGKHCKILASDAPTENLSNMTADVGTPRFQSCMDFNEYHKLIEDKLKHATECFEEKLTQTFYMLRINASKHFIHLEEKLSENWSCFVEYLKRTNQVPSSNHCQRGSEIFSDPESENDNESDVESCSTQNLHNG